MSYYGQTQGQGQQGSMPDSSDPQNPQPAGYYSGSGENPSQVSLQGVNNSQGQGFPQQVGGYFPGQQGQAVNWQDYQNQMQQYGRVFQRNFKFQLPTSKNLFIKIFRRLCGDGV
jgi:hypothetical protein